MIPDKGSFLRTRFDRRSTRQRAAILSALRASRTHPSAKDILSSVRRMMPHISVGTVYRNLKVLRDEGVIRELVCGKAGACYDGFTQPHYHFVCRACGRIYDVELPVDIALEQKAGRKCGHEVTAHSLEFYGECSGCSPRNERT